MIKYSSFKKVLFLLNPETAHSVAEFFLVLFAKINIIKRFFVRRYFVDDEVLHQNIFNQLFKHPIGLAAGFDKNATMISGAYMLGFAYTEVGTVTKVPQSGNEKPRLFRFQELNSLQNAMGFNNKGADTLQNNIKNTTLDIPVGISIGKNKTTKDGDTMDEYLGLIKKFKNSCDYIAINISSPNTPALRDLQNEIFIKELFGKATSMTAKPILLKLSCDIDKKKAIKLCRTAIKFGCSGIIATNTSVEYGLLDGAKDFGGISGQVIKDKAFELFEAIAKEFYGKTLLVSVGGISSAQDVYKRIKAGASLVQIYTSLIYQGPQICKDINSELIVLLKKDGYNNISQVIGANR